ncbi:MAG: hypothetical protein JWL83_2309 [Actinomycetia bacterium]|nr:hypothetical protein [Actinomycetes bacterium]
MRPTVSEQLAGIRRILAEIVLPQITDAYAAEVTSGLLGTLDLLSASWVDVPRFLRWDCERASAVLESVGISPPNPPDDPLDLVALELHHREVRGELERAMPVLLECETARVQLVELFRERADRFPLSVWRAGGLDAHTTR